MSVIGLATRNNEAIKENNGYSFLIERKKLNPKENAIIIDRRLMLFAVSILPVVLYITAPPISCAF